MTSIALALARKTLKNKMEITYSYVFCLDEYDFVVPKTKWPRKLFKLFVLNKL